MTSGGLRGRPANPQTLEPAVVDVDRSTVIGIALASALVPLNSTMVAVALPKIAKSFDIGRGRAGVLITVYLVIMLIGQPVSGKLSDVIGNKRAVVAALIGFATCSVAAAVAGSFRQLVIARGLQAAFASALAPSVQSMLRAVTAPEVRGHVFGILGSVIGVGAAGGPLVGGALVSAFGWHAVFLANLPIVVVALAVLWHVDVPAPHKPGPTPSGGRSAANSTRVAHGAPGLRSRAFGAAATTQATSNLGQYLLLLIAPILLDARGWSSAATGVALSSLTVGLIIMGPPGGRHGDTAGRRRSVALGIGVATVGVALLLPFGADITPAVLITALLLFGIGLGFASPGIMTAGIEAAPDDQVGLAAGLLSMSRYVGSITASVIVSKTVADDGSGVGLAYIVAAVALLVALGSTSGLPGRRVVSS